MATKISKRDLDLAVDKHLGKIPLSMVIVAMPMPEDGEGNIQPFVINNLRKFIHVAMRMVRAPSIIEPKLKAFAEFLDTYCDGPYTPDGTFDESKLSS